MQIKRLRKGLPRHWQSHPFMPPLAGEFDLPLGSLYAKLLVFRNRRALQTCWRDVIEKPLGKIAPLGAVNGLFQEVITVNRDQSECRFLRCDPRYFCVIGLTLKNLSMEVITHEAVHAALCYVKRKTRAPWAKLAKENDEEEVAYPAGRIAKAINRVLWDNKLYGEGA